MSQWASLLTEQRNPATTEIDTVSTLELVRIIHQEDAKVIPAITAQLPQIAQAVDRVADALGQGGRLFYLGAGTSGRLGILDASECPPTFSVSPDLIQGLIAGGTPAVFQAVEGAEDDRSGAVAALKERMLLSRDLVLGIAASGVTPFVLGGIDFAKQLGCGTLFFTCSPSAAAQVPADIKIIPAVGPEVITGSTRMKAGTATKLVLNMISTGAMIKLGKTYSNLMVDLQPKNAKLKDRSSRILALLADLDAVQAEALLHTAAGNLKLALVMALCATDAHHAQQLLDTAQGHVKKAVSQHVT